MAAARLDLYVRGHEGPQHLAFDGGHTPTVDDAAPRPCQRLLELLGRRRVQRTRESDTPGALVDADLSQARARYPPVAAAKRRG